MSLPPLLIQAGALVLFLLAVVLRPVAQGVGPSEGLPVLSVRPTLTPAIVLGLALAYAFSLVWLAVRWHRFVLLNERAHPLSPPPRAAMWRYVGIGVTGGGGSLAFVIVLILMFLASALMLVLGTALPGATIGAPHPLRAAWNGMKPAGGVVLLLTIAGSLLNWLAQVALELLQRSDVVPVGVYLGIGLILYWLSMLFSLSVPTTLWGHFVEGRPLR